MNDPEAGPNMEKKCPQCGAPLSAGGLAGLCPACLLAQGAAETASDTPPFQPPTVAEVAALFPQLEILSLIGKGGMGAVYQARQPVLDRIVALKMLPPQTAGGPDFTERFNREARALARLNHPNIITVHEFGQVHGNPFFIMEYVDGLNLRQLEQAGKLTPREALQIVPQICEALQFAHDAGIVHRDIKPDNILLDKKGRVKIADFGIAKILGTPPETGVPETQGVIGTPHYMAPEQVEKPQSVDHRADIFSLGVVFYEMLTGELPLGKFAPPSAGAHGVRVDVRLDEVVLRALEKEPDRRYQHASQVKTAVETIANTPPGAAGMGGPAGGAPPPPPLSPPGSPPPNPGPSPEAILARDYTLDMGRCLERGWALVKAHFWELVGLHALILLLVIIAESAFARIGNVGNGVSGVNTSDGTSILGLVLAGPLWAGLFLYFLKTIRGEPVTVETAFSGFSKRFLHLFLVNLVAWVLIGLGFACLILPGIYLLVVWCFSLVLVMDQGLDFWPAMELSRKVVHKHWWKVFGFLLVLAGVWVLGLLACCVGALISAPVAMAVFLYAYEDIFGRTPPAAPPGPGRPAGTVVMPPAPLNPPPSGGSSNSTLMYVLIAAAVVFSVPVLFYLIPLVLVLLAMLAPLLLMSSSIHHGLPPHLAGLGPTGWGGGRVWLEIGSLALVFALVVLGLILIFKVIFNLAQPAVSQSTPPRSAAVAGPGVPSSTAGGSRFLKYALVALAAFLALLLLLAALIALVWLRHTEHRQTFQVYTVQPNPPVMPLPSPAPPPPAAPIPTASAETNDSHANFAARLSAAEAIPGPETKSKALGKLARDAARAGDVPMVQSALRCEPTTSFAVHDVSVHDSVLLLAKAGRLQQAIDIAQTTCWSNFNLRDQTLEELSK